jgi:aryl-alcohol dehydrogenase-like predicted oxidoreductase
LNSYYILKFILKDLTASQVAILWSLQRKVTSVIVGVNNLEELEENMKVMNEDILLSFEEVKK